jgi:hypothetical protein
MSDPRFQDPLIDPRRPSVRDPHAQRFRPAGVSQLRAHQLRIIVTDVSQLGGAASSAGSIPREARSGLAVIGDAGSNTIPSPIGSSPRSA